MWCPTVLETLPERDAWGREYNQHRPKEASGAKTPASYAQQLDNNDSITPGF
ncbi:transposase [Xanthomonas oryzae pv. oryzae]|nr:transposase [Xanthomonas oryzae pv. oryzae]